MITFYAQEQTHFTPPYMLIGEGRLAETTANSAKTHKACWLRKRFLTAYMLVLCMVGMGVLKWDGVRGQSIYTYVGNGTGGYSGDNGPASAAKLSAPEGVAIDPRNGNLYIADVGNNRIRKVDRITGIITTVAGTNTAGYNGDYRDATTAQLNQPVAVAVDKWGNLFVADLANHRVRKIDNSGIITTVAGNGFGSYSSGDGGLAVDARIYQPAGLAVDGSGNIYITDYTSYEVRVVYPTGYIERFAGTGTLGTTFDYTCSCDLALDATLSTYLSGIAVDAAGNVYISDEGHQIILQEVYPSISIFAGTNTTYGYVDNITALSGKLHEPTGLAVDKNSNLFISDNDNSVIRKDDFYSGTGFITTYAGNNSTGYSGDCGLSTVASININSTPGAFAGLAVDSLNNLYIADRGNNRIRIVTPTTTPTITGAGAICVLGNTITLTASAPGGNWSSSNTAIATVGAGSGVVTAVTAGSVVITYTLPGCSTLLYATQSITISNTSLPDAITGTMSVCKGDVTTLADATTGGTWSSDNIHIATIATDGTVTGVEGGIAHIAYTTTDGCTSTVPVTVNPYVGEISGPNTVCAGSTITLTDETEGGTWSSGTATVDATTGVVTGIIGGIAIISYTKTCGSYTAIATKNILVNIYAGVIVATKTTICGDGSLTVMADVGGGTWTSEYPAIATVTAISGTTQATVFSSISTGTTQIRYEVDGCGYGLLAAIDITVTPFTPITSSTSSFSFCYGDMITLSDITTGGTWSCDEPVATITTGGVLSATSTTYTSGTANITYSESDGCAAIQGIIVHPLPDPIAGTLSVCAGATTSLTDDIPGGTWSIIAGSSYATISTDGGVYGINAGTVTVKYQLSTGCFTTIDVTVYPIPNDITGSTLICYNGTTIATTTLVDALGGGTWTSDITAVATIDAITGEVTAVTDGTSNITYTVNGCTNWTTVTVNPIPAAITGTPIICYDGSTATTTLTDVTLGGTWTSDNPLVATIGDATIGIVTATGAGYSNISYTVHGCSNTTTLTVDPTPTVSIDQNINIFCPDKWTTTLSATGTGGIGAYTYSWSPVSGLSPATGDAASETVTTLAATTTYNVTITDVLGCHSSASATVVVPSGDCNVCNDADPMHPLRGLGGTVSGASEELGVTGAVTYVPEGNYYIDDNVDILGKVNLMYSTFLINADKQINVAPSAGLGIYGSHLYSCPTKMWNGIVLQSTGSGVFMPQTATLRLSDLLIGIDPYIYNGTLIEDAKQAVYLNNPTIANLWFDKFIDCDNTIFNRNWDGVVIENATSSTDVFADNTYKVSISNTVFTSRDLSYTGFGCGIFPYCWPQTSDMKNLYTSVPDYTAPYNVVNYPAVECHQVAYGTMGIYLKYIGKDTYPDYYSILVGGDASTPANNELNLFDNLYTGIRVANGNLITHNTSFINMRNLYFASTTPANGGAGIYTNMSDATLNDETKYQLIVEPTTGASISTNTQNSFYNCKYGVYSYNYYHIKGDNSYIVTAQNYTATATYDPNTFGYCMVSNAYDQVELSNNTITNTPNGISFTSTFAPGYYVSAGSLSYWVSGFQYAGSLHINNNLIRAALTPAVSELSNHCNAFSIAVQNVCNTPWIIHPTGIVETNNNTITDTWHGILVNGYHTQQAQTASNTITLRSHTGSNEFCYGINHTYNRNGYTWSNFVSGSNPGAISDPHADINRDSLRGYYTANCLNATMGCNGVRDINRGFEFFLQNPNTAWHDNGMQNNRKGYVINKGFINQQGAPGLTMNNDWNDCTMGWTSTNLQTMVFGAYSANVSRFFVYDATLTNPLLTPLSNLSDNPFHDYAHAFGAVITTTTGTINPACVTMTTGGFGSDMALHHTTSSYEPIALNDTDFVNADGTVRSWLGQYAAWQNIGCDSDLIDSSAIMDTFISLASNSRYAYIANIENDIINGDFVTANALIATPPAPLVGSGQYYDSTTGVTIVDDSTNNYIVDNYRMFYSTYINYITGVMTCTDSGNVKYMANLCPSLYGTVVYQSRSLFTAVFNQLRVWNDDSCFVSPDSSACQCGQNGRRGKIKQYNNNDAKNAQKFALLPNPNSGNFTLRQLLTDTKPVDIQIWNAIGQTIYKQQVVFIGKEYKVDIGNMQKGIYMLQLLDANGHSFTYKFAIK